MRTGRRKDDRMDLNEEIGEIIIIIINGNDSIRTDLTVGGWKARVTRAVQWFMGYNFISINYTEQT